MLDVVNINKDYLKIDTMFEQIDPVVKKVVEKAEDEKCDPKTTKKRFHNKIDENQKKLKKPIKQKTLTEPMLIQDPTDNDNYDPLYHQNIDENKYPNDYQHYTNEVYYEQPVKQVEEFYYYENPVDYYYDSDYYGQNQDSNWLNQSKSQNYASYNRDNSMEYSQNNQQVYSFVLIFIRLVESINTVIIMIVMIIIRNMNLLKIIKLFQILMAM